MNTVTIGSLLFVNYGAMYPSFHAEVVRISDCGNFVESESVENPEHVMIHHITDIKTEVLNSGSPIGVFLLNRNNL